MCVTSIYPMNCTRLRKPTRLHLRAERCSGRARFYDWLLDYHQKRGKTEGLFDTKLANYVFSRKPPTPTAAGVDFVSEPVKAFAQRLRATPGKQIWMMGGGELIASFLDAGEIDEFDIHVIPVFIGEGIPLVAPRRRDIPLRLLSAKKYPDGVVRVRYEVAR